MEVDRFLALHLALFYTLKCLLQTRQSPGFQGKGAWQFGAGTGQRRGRFRLDPALRRAFGCDDAMLDRIASEIRNIVQVEISGERRLMKLRRLYGDVQDGGNLLAAPPFGRQLQDLPLVRIQAVRGFATRLRGRNQQIQGVAGHERAYMRPAVSFIVTV